MTKICYTMHDRFAAKKFVEPLILHAQNHGYDVFLISPAWAGFNKKANVSPSYPTHNVDHKFSANPLKILLACRKLLHILKVEKPDIVHAHMLWGSILSLTIARILGVKHRIYHNHGLSVLGYSGAMAVMFWILEKYCMTLATTVIFVSQSNLDGAVKLHLLPDKKAYVIGEGSAVGVEIPQIQPQFTMRVPLKFGYIGRPFKRKGFHLMLDAWSELAMHPEVATLLIAGCSPKDVARCAQKGAVLEGVDARGFVDNMKDFYDECDVVVLPSFHEGFSYALLEGASYGKLLIASNVPGNTDAVKDGVTGILHQAGNKEDLKSKIRYALEHPAEVMKLRMQAYERTKGSFDREGCLVNMLTFYKHILSLG